MRSIRTALVGSLLVGVAAASVASGFVLHAQAGSSLVAQFDAALLAKARAIASLLELEDPASGLVEFDYSGALRLEPHFAGGEQAEYFQILAPDGEILERSDSLVERPSLPLHFGELDLPEYFDLDLPDGRRGRGIGIVLRLDRGSADGGVDESADDALPEAGSRQFTKPVESGAYVVVQVARARDEVDAALAALRKALWIAGGLLLLAVTLVVAIAVSRGLRPLVALGDEVERIDVATLTGRVDRDRLPSELQPLAGKLNELLSRIESSFERERRMTGNVAHELRTPIAELRSAVEISQRWPDDLSLRDAAIETALAVSKRMGDVVAGLLRLSRLTSGTAKLECSDVEIRELVARQWDAVSSRAGERELRFENRTPEGVIVRTDRTLLTVAVSNLLDNAVRFAEPSSVIRCHLAFGALGEAGSATWTFENETRRLDASDLPRLTEPFWQKDGARSDDTHAGLGLTLVQAVAEALGMKLCVRLAGTFAISLTMPVRRARVAAAG